MNILQWSDNQKVYRFRKGLKPHIKKLLINKDQYSKEKDFETLYTNARKAENDLNIKQQKDKGLSFSKPQYRDNRDKDRRPNFQPSQFRKPGGGSTAYGTHSGPMDLNAAPKKSKPGRTYTKLTQDEKEQRFKKGQCFYCKETGHYVSDCPVAKAKKGSQGKGWKDNRKAMVASNKKVTEGVEKGKVVYSLGGAESETKND